MKIPTILVTALAAGSLCAQAPDKELDKRIQVFGEMIRPAAFTIFPGVQDQAQRSWGVGVRFMGEIASSRNWYYEIGGKLDSSSNLTFDGPTSALPGAPVADLTDVKITSSYWSVGAGYLIPVGNAVALGLHLEGRGEALTAQGAVFQAGAMLGNVDASTTYLRPWARVSLDASFHLGSTRPFIGVDVAATPLKTSQQVLVSPVNMDNRTLRSLAPTASAAFYAGLHF